MKLGRLRRVALAIGQGPLKFFRVARRLHSFCHVGHVGHVDHVGHVGHVDHVDHVDHEPPAGD